MKLSRLHDSTLGESLITLQRRLRRLVNPLLSSTDETPGTAQAPSLYGDRRHAESEFHHHARLAIDAPELDRRLLLLAGLGAALDSAEGHCVLDIGGSTGLHRTQIEGLLGRQIPLSWAVVETQAYCDAARDLGRTDTTYFCSIDAALSAGLRPTCVYSNSALQYFDDPMAVLEQLINSGARAIVLERIPFGTGPKTKHARQILPGKDGTVHHAPIALASAGAVYDTLSAHGFQVALYRISRAAFRSGVEWFDVYSVLAVKPAHASPGGQPKPPS